jgi:hypothetical protein
MTLDTESEILHCRDCPAYRKTARKHLTLSTTEVGRFSVSLPKVSSKHLKETPDFSRGEELRFKA